MEPTAGTPVTIALVNDYDIVVMGIAHILEQYRDRVVVAELDTKQSVSDTVDVVLYDSFGQPESDHDEISVLIRNPRARRVAVYTWNFEPDLIDSARKHARPSPHRALARTALTGPGRWHYQPAAFHIRVRRQGRSGVALEHGGLHLVDCPGR